jgi:hypothetical protein
MGFNRRDANLEQRIASEYQKTSDQSFAWESLISMHLALPSLRGFWPMSVVAGSSTAARDLSSVGLHLTNSGVQYGPGSGHLKYVPVAHFGAASSDRLYRTDSADFYVAGTETHLISTGRGLTAGLWVSFDDLGVNNEVLMGQWDSGANDRSWMLYADTNGAIHSYISSGGTFTTNKAFAQADHGIGEDDDTWNHIVLQWSPSAQDDHLRIWVNGQYEETTSVGYATLHNSSANFGIGHSYSSGTPGSYFEGQISMAFMCGANISDEAIKRLYYRTRPAFQSRNLW